MTKHTARARGPRPIAERRGPLPIVKAALLAVAAVGALPATGQGQAGLHGNIKDPVGALVPGAQVDLLDDRGRTLAKTAADAGGAYRFAVPQSGRYSVHVEAATFQPVSTASVFVSANGDADLDVFLATRTETEEVTVTATGIPTPEAQVGASVTRLDADQFRETQQVHEALRLVPGAQLTQTGQAGGTTALYIRGGDSDANKVLVDGVPANDIGGAVEFANLATAGIQSIEVLREPDSALYGSDALSGVVNLLSKRGATPLPLFTASGDGGNLGTYRQEETASGLFRQFDYYSAYARLDTRNNLPNDQFHDGTFIGNLGYSLNAKNAFRFTARHIAARAGQPNATAFYGIADAAGTRDLDSFYTGSWDGQVTPRAHAQIRYGALRLDNLFTDYAPTGLLDANGNYLGAPVTLTGANGYSVSGQAIFQFGGSTYPNTFESPTERDFVYAQTDFRINPHLFALGGFKFENERGSTIIEPGAAQSSVNRGNYSYTAQFQGDWRHRLFYTVGTGLEDNGLFGFAATPRVSLAGYLRQPSQSSRVGGTKLHGTFGKGIKEPSLFQQTNSLLAAVSALPNGPQLVGQLGIAPIGAITSRLYDGGVTQEFYGGRVRAGATYFHNEFTNVVEFVPQSGLVEIGVPASAASENGAYVNSQAFRAQGLEVEGEYRASSHLYLRGGYTLTDAVVQRSFSSDNLQGGSFNTAGTFADVPIGAFSPLDGQRPFRRAPHTGYFAATYARSKWYAGLTGTLVGRRDDSDFLTDSNFGNSLLLPNRNLAGSYERLDADASYDQTRALTWYARISNLLNENYQEAFGYPALPATVRAGVTVRFGGESWGLR